MRKLATNKLLALTTLFLLMQQIALAQPPPGSNVPLDGVSGLLLLAGAVFGVRKLMKKERE